MMFTFAAALASAWLAASGSLAWTPATTSEKDLRDGKPVSEVSSAADDAVLIHAAIDIPAPPKLVWMVMSDCGRASRLVVTVTSCRILQSDPAHGTEVRETITRGNLFMPTLDNIIREQMQPYTLIRFQKAGGNLKQEEGEWRLVALPGGAGTRVIYENLVGAPINAPAPLVRAEMRRSVAKVMVNLKHECAVASSEAVRTPGRPGE